jgi:hypothetical protein
LAITTQAQYRTHVLAALKAMIQADPSLFLPLIPGFYAYAQTGNDPREAMEMLLSWAQPLVLPGPYDAHRMKHLLTNAGVPSDVAQNVAQRAEP